MVDRAHILEFFDDMAPMAKIYASKVRGDSASKLMAQAAEESAFGTSRLFREGNGARFGIREAKNKRYQSGVVLLPEGPHAAYADSVDAYRDRTRILLMYQGWVMEGKPGAPASPWDIWALLDWQWCTIIKNGLRYSERCKRIIQQWDLEKYDTDHSQPNRTPIHSQDRDGYVPDVVPSGASDVYTPTDPRDVWQPGQQYPRDVGHQGRGQTFLGKFAMPILFGGVAAHLITGGASTAKLVSAARGLVTSKGSVDIDGLGGLLGSGWKEGLVDFALERILPSVFGAIGVAESPNRNRFEKEDLASKLLQGIGVSDTWARALIPLAVQALNDEHRGVWEPGVEEANEGHDLAKVGQVLLQLLAGRLSAAA